MPSRPLTPHVSSYHSSLLTPHLRSACDLPFSPHISSIVAVIADTLPLAEAKSLVARARAGDFSALEQLYRAYERPVYTLARRLTRNAEDAEDVLQETFLEVCRSLKQWRGEGNLWGWIRTIAASKALMRYRREKLREWEPLNDDVPHQPEDIPLQMDLEAALARLPERSRAVVWLHDVEGYTHEEIAELMGMTTSFSKSQLARAHDRLRRWLGAGVEA